MDLDWNLLALHRDNDAGRVNHYGGQQFVCSRGLDDVCSVYAGYIPAIRSLIVKPVNNSSNMDSSCKRRGGVALDANSIHMVCCGNAVKEESKTKQVLQQNKITKDQSLSLFHGEQWPWKELQLVAPDPHTSRSWRDWLSFITANQPTQFCDDNKMDSWLKKKYMDVKINQGGHVHSYSAISSISHLKLWQSNRLLSDILKDDEQLSFAVEACHDDLPFDLFQALYYAYIIRERPDIVHLYNQYARETTKEDGLLSSSPPIDVLVDKPKKIRQRKTKDRRGSLFPTRESVAPITVVTLQKSQEMSVNSFLVFLQTSQGSSNITLNDAQDILFKYDFHFGKDAGPTHVPLRVFAHYLMSQETGSQTIQPSQDLTQPLANYFIASSHNTYLTGHQLYGDSSTAMYASVLLTGCRCVELDCWDGDDGEPMIYHGHTFTSKIKFENTVRTIAAYAFKSSSYPLILSLENHCSIPQQIKMVHYMKKYFGSSLVSDFIDGNPFPTTLPSPKDLINRVLVKNRKAHLKQNLNSSPNISPPTSSHGFFPVHLTPQSASSPCMSTATTPCSPVTAAAQFKFPFPTSQSSPPCSPSNYISIREFLDSDHQACSLPSTPAPGGNSGHDFMYTIFEEDIRRASQANQLQINLHPQQEAKPRRESNSVSLPLSPMRPTTPNFYVEDDDEEIFDPPPRVAGRRRGMMVKDSLDDSGCDIVSPDTTPSFLAPVPAANKFHSSPEPLAKARQQRSRKLALAQTPEVILGSSLSEDVLVKALHKLDKTSASNVKRQVETAKAASSSPKTRPHPGLCQSASSGQQPCVLVQPSFDESGHHRSDNETSRHGPSVMSPMSAKSQTLPPRSIASSDRFRKRRCSDPIFFSKPDDSVSSKLVSVTRRRGSMLPTTPTSIVQSNTSSGASLREDTLEEQKFVLSSPSTSGVDDSSCSSSSPRPNLKPLTKAHTAHTFMSPVSQKKSLYSRRRGSSATELRSAAENVSQIVDTAEAIYSKKDIAPELSDLVIYTETKKFHSFKTPKQQQVMKCTEMYSIAEAAAKKANKKNPHEFYQYNSHHLSRVYPAPMRLSSSNYNPALFWMSGCQMVAMNYQTSDDPMQYYHTFFKQNGACGYVLKPPELEEQFKLRLDQTSDHLVELKISLVSVQLHQSTLLSTASSSSTTGSMFLPSVEIEIFGAPKDCMKHKIQSSSIAGPLILFERETTFTARLSFPCLAAVKFTLCTDKDSSPFTYMGMFSAIHNGYQHVFFDGEGCRLDLTPCILFLNVQGASIRKFNGRYSSQSSACELSQCNQNSSGLNASSFVSMEESNEFNDCGSHGDQLSSSRCLAVVTIHYSDLPKIEHDYVTMFADATTTAGDLLAGALAKLGRDVYTACKDITDREDEDQLNEHFQLVLAKQNAGQFKYLRPLGSTDSVFPYFVGNTENSLFVTLKRSATAPAPVSVSSTSCTKTQLLAVSVMAPVKSSAYQTKKVSVEVKLLQPEIKRVHPELSVFRQVSPRFTSVQRLSDEVTFPLKQKSATSRIAKLKNKLKKKLFHSSLKEDRGMDGCLPLSPELAWEQQLSCTATKTSTVTTVADSTTPPIATLTTAAGRGSQKKRTRRYSHDQNRRVTVKTNIRRSNTINMNPKPKSTSMEEPKSTSMEEPKRKSTSMEETDV